jgi:hypothetical protein
MMVANLDTGQLLEAVPPGSNRERFGTIVVGPPLGDALQKNINNI